MNNTESLKNQTTFKNTPVQQTGLNNTRWFIFLFLSILFTSGIVGIVVYSWQKSINEKNISIFQQKINSLEKQISTMNKATTSLQTTLTPTLSSPAFSPTPSAGIIDNWKTYANDSLSFRYPPNWHLEKDGMRIVGINPDVVINIATQNTPLMNECMRKDTSQIRDGIILQKYSRITSGAMCATDDIHEQSMREIWIIPEENSFSPGISYRYSAEDNPEAEDLFNQLISTFKWTH